MDEDLNAKSKIFKFSEENIRDYISAHKLRKDFLNRTLKHYFEKSRLIHSMMKLKYLNSSECKNTRSN